MLGELVSNGGDGSNHGSAPRVSILRPTAPRAVPGLDPDECRPSDLEMNSLVVGAGEAVKDEAAEPRYSIERRYREIELEVYYYNDTLAPSSNCDREGPVLGTGPFGGAYHRASGATVEWAVPATDASGVWRVVVVANDNRTDAAGRGVWSPVELVEDGGTWRGSLSVSGASTLTYVIQAVDKRGNLTWLDYVSSQLPASGVPLGVPQTVDVSVSGPAEADLSVTKTDGQDLGGLRAARRVHDRGLERGARLRDRGDRDGHGTAGAHGRELDLRGLGRWDLHGQRDRRHQRHREPARRAGRPPTP